MSDEDPGDAVARPTPLDEPIGPGRLISLSDGVIAVIITILVLEFAVPAGGELSDLLPLIPKFLAYALSFTFVGIYWNNHHHLLRATVRVSASVMWANLGLLFWLALIPFVTAWLGDHPGETWPTFVYGVICLITGAAYGLLARTIVSANPDQAVAARIGRDYKGWLSVALYGAGCVIALLAPYVAIAAFVAVAVIWFIPDRRLTGRGQAHPRAHRGGGGSAG
jgi:uncharacterized membrane protein